MARDLFRIIQGDEDNLKGDAILFCTLKEDEQRKVIAVYATDRGENYIKRVGKERFEKLKKIFESFDHGYIADHFSQFYTIYIDYENEKDNLQGVDILELGEYNTKKDCEIAIMGGISKYIELYTGGILKKQESLFKKPMDHPNYFLSELNRPERDKYAIMCHIVD